MRDRPRDNRVTEPSNGPDAPPRSTPGERSGSGRDTKSGGESSAQLPVDAAADTVTGSSGGPATPPAVGGSTKETTVTAPSLSLLQKTFVGTGLFLVAFGVLVWFAPRAVVVDLLGSVEGREDGTRWTIVIGLVLVMAMTRYFLPTAPVQPIAAPEDDERSVGSTTRQLAIQPGIDVDDRLREILSDQEEFERRRHELTDDLREIAIGSLCYTRKLSRNEAIDRLESGEWTTNATAAALFMDRTNVPFRIRFNRWVSPRRTYRQEVWAAVTELSEVTSP